MSLPERARRVEDVAGEKVLHLVDNVRTWLMNTTMYFKVPDFVVQHARSLSARYSIDKGVAGPSVTLDV